jgi:hypothetical protein
MADAIDWIKSKARPLADDTLVIGADTAAEAGIEPGTYKVRTVYYRGTLPNRMVAQIRKGHRPLISTEYEHETLKLGGAYRSDYGRCEFWHTTYKRT